MSYTKNQREGALADLKNGLTKAAVNRKYNIPRPTLYRWIEEDNPAPPMVLSQFNMKKLLAERNTLAVENEILHRAGCSEISPKTVRQEAYQRLAKDYALKTLARVLGLSVGDAHYLRDAKVKTRISAIEDLKYAKRIKEVFIASNECYGTARVKAALAQQCITISERRISRLMQAMKLHPKHVTYRWVRTSPRRVYYPNKLKRRFTQEAPNRVWTADCTYLRVGDRWYYAVAIIDLFSRRVVGWGLSDERTAAFIANVFKRAFIERGEPKGLIFHSDQGSEFIEFLFKVWARNQGIILSYSAPGTPIDNAVSESFFATVKKELVRNRNYASEKDLFNALAEYIQFYNEERIHTRIGMRSPAQFEKAYEEGKVKILD